MCLLVLAWEVHPRYGLVVAANRDEFHERPAAAIHRWAPPDDILAGKDLRAGGTWLGIDRQRRFGVVTNFRERQRPAPNAPSRGQLIPRFLTGRDSAEEYLAALGAAAAAYSGFNLLIVDSTGLWTASNRSSSFKSRLAPGIYALSNEFLDTPWPKVRRLRQRFDAWLADPGRQTPGELFSMLADDTPAGPGDELPRTGLSPEWEQILSAPFVRNLEYGTRCSTVLMLERSGAMYLAERRFGPQGVSTGETEFVLAPGEWPE